MTCQFVYQIVFLVTVTMYAWNIHIEGNYKYCCSLRCIKQNEEILELLGVSQLFVIIGSEIEHKVRGFRTTNPPGNSLHCYYIDGVAWYGNHELRIIVLAPLRQELATFVLIIFNILALKFLYCCFALRKKLRCGGKYIRRVFVLF